MEKDKELAITPTEIDSKALAAVMQNEAEKRALITQYISVHMKPGTDYGTIKFGNKESKPSLFKPGSEKFLSLFKLTAQFEKDADTWEMAGSEAGVFAYKCRLLTSKKQLVGEGRGVSKLTEKAGWTINNAVKIAEKRAQIDAVLRTGALSDFFTQDLEDMAQNQYDQTPISAKAVPTVTYDDHEGDHGGETESGVPTHNVSNSKPWNKPAAALKLTINARKKKIKELIDSITLNALAKGEYEIWVRENVKRDLTDQTPGNLDLIIDAIEEMKTHDKSNS